MLFKKNFLIFLGLVFVSFTADSAPPEKPPKKWPCDQVYNPKLNLSSIWQGPSIDKAIKDWWKDDTVIEYVNQLADPVLEEEKGIELIEEFAKKHTYFGILKKGDRDEKMTFLFAGLYQKAKDRRSGQYVGIIKFVERQESLRKAIGSASKQIRKLRKEKS